jgi:hypothetical protein
MAGRLDGKVAFITGQQIRVDAGSFLKFPNWPGK